MSVTTDAVQLLGGDTPDRRLVRGARHSDFCRRRAPARAGRPPDPHRARGDATAGGPGS
jgi:hypothetical protein